MASLSLCTPWTGGMWVCPGHQEQCCDQVSRWLVGGGLCIGLPLRGVYIQAIIYSMSQPYKLRGHVLGLGP